MVPGQVRRRREETSEDGNFDTPTEIKTDPLYGHDAFHCVGDSQCSEVADRKLMECHAQQPRVRWPEGLLSQRPFGLKLQITPALINSIEHRLNNSSHLSATASEAKPRSNTSRLGLSPTKVSDLLPNEKLKAACFSASTIRIGSWERTSIYENDLVAKIYFAKRKVVWEVLQSSRRKSKIEMPWTDIVGIRATTAENQPGTLEVELANPPSFQYEQEPQPRKHTRWNPASDFTDGQASICRIHLLTFPPGAMDKHIEKLFLTEPRMHELSRGAFPTLPSPYFDTHINYGPTNFSFAGFNGGYQRFGFQHLPCGPSTTVATQPSFNEFSPMSDQHFLHNKDVYENPRIKSLVEGSTSLSGGQAYGIMSNVATAFPTPMATTQSGEHSRGDQGGYYDPRLLNTVEKLLLSESENLSGEQPLVRIDSWNALVNVANDRDRDMESGAQNMHYVHDRTLDDNRLVVGGNETVHMVPGSQFYQQLMQPAPGMPASVSHVQPMLQQNWGNLAYPSARAEDLSDSNSSGGSEAHSQWPPCGLREWEE